MSKAPFSNTPSLREVREKKLSPYPLVNIVDSLFPDLVEFAETKATQVTEPEDLVLLIERIVLARDENQARQALGAPILFDPLFEEDPWVKEKVEKGRAEGLIEGRAEGLIEGRAEGRAGGTLKALRSTLSNIVEHRFPRLIELAEEKAAKIEQSEALNILVVQVSVAVDEQAARSLLEQ